MAIQATATKVLVVDDHPMVREGLAMRIASQPDMTICGEAATEEEALVLLKETQPDLIIIDISLRRGHGIDLIKQVKARAPRVKMLVVSTFPESLYAERALRAGAHGYLNKQESINRVLEAMRAVMQGERFISTELTERLVNQSLNGLTGSLNPLDKLSNRELEIFRLIGEGLSSGAIAERLFVSTHTIDTHRENLKRKLGLKNGAELTRAAVQWLLEPDS